MAQRLFCFGLGYSAEVLARRLMAKGWSVTGTVRQPDRQAALAERGIDTCLFDGTAGLPDGALEGCTHLLSSAPPLALGDPVLSSATPAIVAAAPGLRWLGYLSTTAVYGDWNGGWVDETSPLSPSSERAHRRVAAERAWLALGEQIGVPAHVFRLAGIYGPGRNALEDLRAGTARRIVKPGQVFSRIHVDDIAAVLDASMARPRAGGIYNVCDDEAAPPQDVVSFAADLLGIEPPPLEPFDPAHLSAMAQTFWLDNKHVANRLLASELGVRLTYPTYREGLRALAASVNSAASSANSATTRR